MRCFAKTEEPSNANKTNEKSISANGSERIGKPPWQHGIRIKQCEINAFEDNRPTLHGTARLRDSGRIAGLVRCDLESQKLLTGGKRLGVARRDHDLCPCRHLSELVEDLVFRLFHGGNVWGRVSCTNIGIAKSPLEKAFATCVRCIRILSQLVVSLPSLAST